MKDQYRVETVGQLRTSTEIADIDSLIAQVGKLGPEEAVILEEGDQTQAARLHYRRWTLNKRYSHRGLSFHTTKTGDVIKLIVKATQAHPAPNR